MLLHISHHNLISFPRKPEEPIKYDCTYLLQMIFVVTVSPKMYKRLVRCTKIIYMAKYKLKAILCMNIMGDIFFPVPNHHSIDPPQNSIQTWTPVQRNFIMFGLGKEEFLPTH